MKDNRFYPQVELMLSILSDVMAESCFALKGGTAINLFVRDMPRLSVDIDLTYLPLRGRDESLEGISNALERIASRIVRHRPATEIHKSFAPGGRRIVKLVVSQPGAHVKVEPNTILRGTVFPCQEAQLCAAACQEFRLDAQVRTVSLPDLYGGKICAALDRQHPRDFFDVMLLLANEGLTDAIRSAFVIYLASHNRPMAELLSPRLADFRRVFDDEFAGMTAIPVSHDQLCEARDALIKAVNSSLTMAERRFLLSIKDGEPEWDLICGAQFAEMPAIQWKLANIRKMSSAKRRAARAKLAQILGI